METIQYQGIRAILNDLRTAIAPAVGDPSAQALAGMAQQVMAYVLTADAGLPDDFGTIDDELRSFDAHEAAEQVLLSSTGVQSDYRAITAELVEPYVQERLGDPDVRIMSLKPTLGGFSKVTYIVRLSGADAIGNALVIRRDAEYESVAIRSAEEYPILRAVCDCGVDAPEPLWADEHWPFGGSILISRLAPGTSVFDGSATHVGENARPAALALARSLAGLHAVPLASVDVPGIDAAAPLAFHVGRTLDMLERLWATRRLVTSPTIDAALAWARANIPGDGPGPVIVHGDASLRNYLYDADSGVGTLLDWELWHVGDPTEDLESCRSEIERFMPWQDFAQAYVAAGGTAYRPEIGAYYDMLIPLWQAINTAAVLAGFKDVTKPEIRGIFVGTWHYRRLVREIARRLRGLDKGN